MCQWFLLDFLRQVKSPPSVTVRVNRMNTESIRDFDSFIGCILFTFILGVLAVCDILLISDKVNQTIWLNEVRQRIALDP